MELVDSNDALFDIQYELVEEEGHCTNSRGLNPAGMFTQNV